MNPTQQPMSKVLPSDEEIATTEGRQRRTIALGKVDLLATVSGLVFLAGAYWIILPEAVALLVLTVVLLTVTRGPGTLAEEISTTGSYAIPSVVTYDAMCCSA